MPRRDARCDVGLDDCSSDSSVSRQTRWPLGRFIVIVTFEVSISRGLSSLLPPSLQRLSGLLPMSLGRIGIEMNPEGNTSSFESSGLKLPHSTLAAMGEPLLKSLPNRNGETPARRPAEEDDVDLRPPV